MPLTRTRGETMKSSSRTHRAVFVLSAAAVALIVAVSAAFAASDKPVRVEAGNLILTVAGGLKPKAISRETPTPVGFYGSGGIQTKDGAHPPALKEVIVEGDRNVTLDTTGYPTCPYGLQSDTTRAAEAACRSAIIGKGTITVGVQFPEQPPVDVNSKLLVLNGGTAGGVTKLFVHTYFSAPVNGAIVTTVMVKEIHKGRYGTLAVATVPKIAGGAGSVTAFDLTIDKKYTHQGKRMSVFMATCPNGSLRAKVTGKFADGATLAATLSRSCTPKG
jgi:hypothetical protein